MPPLRLSRVKVLIRGIEVDSRQRTHRKRRIGGIEGRITVEDHANFELELLVIAVARHTVAEFQLTRV